MLRRRVADIALPAIAGIAPSQLAHDLVARHLGDDRGGGDRQAPPVAADHRPRRAGQGRRDIAVDQRGVGHDAERAHGALHRQQRGAQDVDAVDLAHAGGADADDGAAPDRQAIFVALLGAQHLRIVDAPAQRARHVIEVEHDRRRHHRSGERAAADLVDAADDAAAFILEGEIGHGGRVSRRVGGGKTGSRACGSRACGSSRMRGHSASDPARSRRPPNHLEERPC